MKQLRKKGVIDNLGNLVQSLGVIAILAAVIFLIIAATKAQVLNTKPCEGTYIYNASAGWCSPTGNSTGAEYNLSHAYQAVSKTQESASDIPSWLPIVVITVIGGVLLTLVRFFKSGQ